MSTRCGRTATDLYAFGGRGFSIFQQNADGTIVKVDETGGDFEQILAALPNAGTVFNGENGGGFDSRSDNKGAEPEGVAVGDGERHALRIRRAGARRRRDGVGRVDPAGCEVRADTSRRPRSDYRAGGHQVRQRRGQPDRPRHADHRQRDQRQRDHLRHRRSGRRPRSARSRAPVMCRRWTARPSRRRASSSAVDTNGSRGFYIQDPNGDGNAATSDGDLRVHHVRPDGDGRPAGAG